jgi:L-ascorbate metabolism protein UlaG (beta-lactamase superfamily)
VYDISGIAAWPYKTVSGDPIYEEGQSMAKLLYQGHGSLRLTTAEGKVIYIDPYAGGGYDVPADLILVTHQHGDHNQVNLIASRNPGCEVITEKESLKDGRHQTFDLGYVTAEAAYAGNKNHDPKQCAGYILTLSDSIQIYISGDTSKTAQMETLAERGLDYAFFCCDGVYNMDMTEASECAALIGARHSIPYHMAPGKLFDRGIAEQFEAQGRLIVAAGEEIALNKE